jgi:3-oxoacyl-[acyl-carrier-protein] synthase I
MQPFAIEACGMVTPVGLDAPSSCAAMRAGIDGFVATRFMVDGAWLSGGLVPLDAGQRGREKLLVMAAMAIQECLALVVTTTIAGMLIYICLPESERPGNPVGAANDFTADLWVRLGLSDSTITMKVIAQGRIGAVKAMQQAGQLLGSRYSHCLIVGVDTFLTPETLAYYADMHRLLTRKVVDGFIA